VSEGLDQGFYTVLGMLKAVTGACYKPSDCHVQQNIY